MNADRDDVRRVIVDGLAALAVSIAEMGGTESDARLTIIGQMERLRVEDPGLLREAANAIAEHPQPLDEPAATLERREAMYQALGLPTASDQLAASLAAREWLTNLADLLDEFIDG